MPKPLLAAFAVFLLLFGAVFGFMVGGSKSAPRREQVPATIDFANRTASFEGASFTYTIRDSVPWIDKDGKLRPGGWPECLTEGTKSGFLYVASRSAEIGGKEVRPVYAVDCSH